ncbi:hypothetical protein TSMEX_008247 [Taenia solium]|eukprot:TsM_001030400 transcript=TsM_001030400 gene=TsM_001030400
MLLDGVKSQPTNIAQHPFNKEGLAIFTPPSSRVVKKEGEERGNPATLVAALADLPHFKDGINFEDWMETARFYIHLLPQRQRVPLILHALPQELFLAAIDAGVTAGSDIGHCCEILSQLAIDQR